MRMPGRDAWGGGSASAWFRAAAAHPLLTPAQEQDLALVVQAGRPAEASLARLARRGSPAPVALAARAAAARRAVERLVCSNLRLVIKIALDHAGCGMPLEDMISEGAIGAQVAAWRFRPGMGAKFSTYASFWIRQRVRRSLCSQGRTVRLPVHVSDKLLRARRATEALAADLGREPSEEEIAAEIGLAPGSFRRIARGALHAVSIDAELRAGEEGGDPGAFGDLIQDAGAPDPSEGAGGLRMIAELPAAMARLEPREAEVLRMRFGLGGGGDPMTLEDAGERLGVSRERIRQIQSVALRKLRDAFGLPQPLRRPAPARPGSGPGPGPGGVSRGSLIWCHGET